MPLTFDQDIRFQSSRVTFYCNFSKQTCANTIPAQTEAQTIARDACHSYLSPNTSRDKGQTMDKKLSFESHQDG